MSFFENDQLHCRKQKTSLVAMPDLFKDIHCSYYIEYLNANMPIVLFDLLKHEVTLSHPHILDLRRQERHWQYA